MKKMMLALVVLVCLAGTTLMVHSRQDRGSHRAEMQDRQLASTVAMEEPDALGAVGAPTDPIDGTSDHTTDRVPAPEVETVNDPAIVEGRVVAPDGTPVADIELYLRDEGIRLALVGGAPTEPPTVRSDIQGRFRFVHAPLRDLQARRFGIGNKRTWISFDTLAPRDKQKTKVDLVLTPGVALEGIVLADGQPIADQQVLLRRRGLYERGPEQGRNGWTFTDVDGRFRFDHLPPGDYGLTVRAPGFEVWGETAKVAADAAPMEVQLRPQRELVVRFENLPAEWNNASVYLHVHDADHTYTQTYLPKIVDGAVRLPAPPTGRYTIRNLSQPGRPLPAMEESFEVTQAPIDPVVFKLERGARVTGIVTKSDGSPFIGTVQLENGETSAKTDQRGRYRFASAPPGPNRVRLSLGHMVLYVAQLDVPASGETRLDIRLAGGARISGRVSSDPKLEFCWLKLLRDGVVLGEGLSYDGTFRFDHLEAGDYTVQVRANGAASRSLEVALAVNQARALEEIRLQRYPRVAVKVTVPHGVKMPSFIYVSTVLAGKPKPVLVLISGTGDGYFSSLPPGTYKIRVNVEGYQPRTIDVTVKPEGSATVPIALER